MLCCILHCCPSHKYVYQVCCKPSNVQLLRLSLSPPSLGPSPLPPLFSLITSFALCPPLSPLPSPPSLPPSPVLSLLLHSTCSYMVSVGLIDRLGDHFNTIVGPIGETELTQLVLGGLNLLVATTACMHTRYAHIVCMCMNEHACMWNTVCSLKHSCNLM